MYPLGTIFPEKDYKRAGSEMVMHYWVVLDQPIEKIKEWVKKYPEWVNHRDPKFFNLTPLAVCARKGNHAAARVFLDNGGDPTLGDHKEWTPFHHAAVIEDKDMLKLLKEKVEDHAAKRLLTHHQGTYEDFQNLFSRRLPLPKEIVCDYREDGVVKPCTAKEFRERTGAIFCNHPFITPQEFIKLWMNREDSEEIDPRSTLLQTDEYERYLSHPPRLSFGKESPSSPQGYDVYVEQPVKAFEVVTTYEGALESEPSQIEYFMEGINGKKIRNLGPMVNDGFPNCFCRKVVYKGILHLMLVAMKDLKSGEKLCWNYGINHGVKLDIPHIELNSEARLCTFFAH